ncbi:MAG: Gfo/Idh/MocA family oxidoreductase, partial [Phycisphaerales bacterium]|nr:Gfo/Idh/MocA family oxidoreductase [Phycisphaerales bacterium]
RGRGVLLQKPMGRDLAEATAIRDVCRRRELVAAVNFQLRFAPMMLALSDALGRGWIGRADEAEVLVNVRTPWQLWPFLRSLPRMEIALHSIHYLDVLRHLLGEPIAAMARTVKGRDAEELASSRTSIILDYGPRIRCCLSVNHHHRHGPRFERSELRLEGDRGAAVAVMGVNLDYPRGRPDALALAVAEQPWLDVPLVGNWFPDAFRGPMSNLQRFLAGEDDALVSSTEDAWHTMRLVEACYASDAVGGVRLDKVGVP